MNCIVIRICSLFKLHSFVICLYCSMSHSGFTLCGVGKDSHGKNVTKPFVLVIYFFSYASCIDHPKLFLVVVSLYTQFNLKIFRKKNT